MLSGVLILTELSPVTNTSSVGEDVRNVVLLVETSEEVRLRSHCVHCHVLSGVITGALRGRCHEPVRLVRHVVLGHTKY